MTIFFTIATIIMRLFGLAVFGICIVCSASYVDEKLNRKSKIFFKKRVDKLKN